jgi:hypothetical protein
MGYDGRDGPLLVLSVRLAEEMKRTPHYGMLLDAITSTACQGG